MHLRGGDRKSKGQAAPLILENFGITRDQSKRWQKLASISDEQVAKYGERATRLGQQTTAAGLHRYAEESRTGTDAAGHQPADKMFVPKQPNASIVRESRAQENQAFACDLKEIANHATMLWQVLSLENNGQTAGLSEAERRAVIYFLGELQTLLNKVSGQASNDSQPTT